MSNYSEISDLVYIDSNERGHRPLMPGTDMSSGAPQFISNHEMDLIVEHQDIIRDQQFDNRIELSKGMNYDLTHAAKKYAEVAAARERSILTPFKTAKKLEAAREQYDDAYNKTREWTNDQLEDHDLDIDTRLNISQSQDKAAAQTAAEAIKTEAEKLAETKGLLAEKRRKFYDWWSRQGGGDKFFSRQRLVGTTKKAAALGIIALPVGIVAGTAGVFLAGPVVGAAAAAGVGRGVTRGLVRGRIEKNADAKNVATAQYEARLADQHTAIEEAYDDGSLRKADITAGVVESVTETYAESSAKQVRRNRRRVLGAIAIGATAGAGGALIGEVAHNLLFGGGSSHSVPKATRPERPDHHLPRHHHHADHHDRIKRAEGPMHRTPNHHDNRDRTQDRTHAKRHHGRTGQEFYVEQGSGISRELQEYAAAHRYHISAVQADQIYGQLYSEHGSDIINLSGAGPNTYTISPGDIGLSHPGAAHWYHGIESEIRHRMGQLTKKGFHKSGKIVRR